MKKWLVTTLAASLVLASPFALSEVQVGEKAPDFTLQDSTGKSRQLSSFIGKTVVLEWTNPKCPFVKKHYDSNNLQKQQSEATKQGVVWLVINSSAAGKQGHVTPEEANTVQTGWNAAQTAYLIDGDGKVGKLYGAKTTPHMYVIDTTGTLRYKGAIDSISSAAQADIAKATQYVPTALAELASGKALTTSVTQPYGCSVKY